MVNAKRALSRFFPSIPTKHYVNLQIVASILVVHSVAVLLPMSINGNFLSSGFSISDNNRFMTNLVGQSSVCVGIATFTILLVDRAHHVFLHEKDAVQESDAVELTVDEQVDKLLPFWGTFCISYVPRKQGTESPIMCFVLSMLCKGAALAVGMVNMLETIESDGDINRNVELLISGLGWGWGGPSKA